MNHSNTPLLMVLKLLVSDPHLRRQFIADPASVFKKLGLGCPLDFVGKRGKLCPIMPDIPENLDAKLDISHQYWMKWLEGGVDQLRRFRQVLANEKPYPKRNHFATSKEWDCFVEQVKQEIQDSLTLLRQQ